MLKDFSNPRHKPITADDVRRELAEQQRREEEERLRPLREAEAELTATHRKLVEIGRKAFEKKQPDIDWVLPASAVGLNLPSMEAAKEFNSQAFLDFKNQTPDYDPSEKNYSALKEFLIAQKVGIATSECWKLAFERLRDLGLLQEKPQAGSQTAPVEEPQPEPVQAKPEEELTPGWDESGNPRNFTNAEIWKMSSDQYFHAFKLYGSRRPSMRRSIYQ